MKVVCQLTVSVLIPILYILLHGPYTGNSCFILLRPYKLILLILFCSHFVLFSSHQLNLTLERKLYLCWTFTVLFLEIKGEFNFFSFVLHVFLGQITAQCHTPTLPHGTTFPHSKRWANRFKISVHFFWMVSRTFVEKESNLPKLKGII